jgi:hypothetical protein
VRLDLASKGFVPEPNRAHGALSACQSEGLGRKKGMRKMLLGSTLGLVVSLSACGGAAPVDTNVPKTVTSSAPTEGTAAKPAAKDDSAEKAQALEALTAEESSKGTCTPAHQAEFEKLRAELETAMKSKKGEDGAPLALEQAFFRITPLDANGKNVEFSLQGKTLSIGHVIAYSAKDVSIDVLVGKTAASTVRSPFQRTALASAPTIELGKAGKVELQSDSRQVEVSPGQPLRVKMTGQGCALLVGFMKH